eukprot:TRINITY_DN15817_c0_g6_i1.p1 TRINITY_DN15817_c0_g6~~TRINITY_DN15817_c0_g6_i1.p1  ORF type:complete len:601 (+),score=36.71 TRINITY_DN15817_c0_g6_i1:106-1908(+)
MSEIPVCWKPAITSFVYGSDPVLSVHCEDASDGLFPSARQLAKSAFDWTCAIEECEKPEIISALNATGADWLADVGDTKFALLVTVNSGDQAVSGVGCGSNLEKRRRAAHLALAITAQIRGFMRNPCIGRLHNLILNAHRVFKGPMGIRPSKAISVGDQVVPQPKKMPQTKVCGEQTVPQPKKMPQRRVAKQHYDDPESMYESQLVEFFKQSSCDAIAISQLGEVCKRPAGVSLLKFISSRRTTFATYSDDGKLMVSLAGRAKSSKKRKRSTSSKDAPEQSKARRVFVDMEVAACDEGDYEDTPESLSLLQCVELIENLPYQERDFPACVSYCSQWLLRGKCPRRARCSYMHSTSGDKPSTGSPSSFGIDDAFKRKCNRILGELSMQMEEKRCFVLDAKGAATVKALKRSPHLILAPNADEDAVASLQSCCRTVRCTSSATLDYAAVCEVRFGCVYLDYMWPLDHFEQMHVSLMRKTRQDQSLQTQQERSDAINEVLTAELKSLDGLEDVKRLFGLQYNYKPSFSDKGAVLAVTLVQPTQQELLEKVLEQESKMTNLSVEYVGRCTEKNRNVATVFYLVGVAEEAIGSLPRGLEESRRYL